MIEFGEEKMNIDIVKTILELMGKDESLIEFVEDENDPWLMIELFIPRMEAKVVIVK